MTQPNIVARVEALEREVAALRRQSRPKGNWRDFIGMFAGDRYFKEAMELGAAYRRKQRPKMKARRAKR